MKYQIQEKCLRIFLPEQFDHHFTEEIRRQTEQLIEKHCIKHLIFDFKDTDFMDCTGVGAIVSSYRMIFLLGGEVRLANLSERMKEIVTTCGLTKIVPIC